MKLPAYRLHKPSGRATIECKALFGGKRRYLPGPYGSPESRDAYEKICRELVSLKMGKPIAKVTLTATATVNQLILQYVPFARGYYDRDSDEAGNITRACKIVKKLYGSTPAAQFGPVALADVREAMIAKGWGRKSINHQIRRVVRMFRWAVENEVIPATNLAALRALSPLRKGKSRARETLEVMPVKWEDVAAVLPYVSPVVAAMIQCHWYLGVRSDEITSLRMCEVDRSQEDWLYVPATHKTEWMGKVKFAIFGPKARAVIAPYLDCPENAYVFSPAVAMREFRHKQRVARRSNLAKAKPSKQRPTLPRYTARSYHNAIRNGFVQLLKAKGVKKTTPPGKHWKPPGIGWREWLAQHGVTYWHPHQLRHARATLTRERYKREGVEAQIGNVKQAVDIYALPSFPLALQIARETG